jgi:hypothetical protein
MQDPFFAKPSDIRRWLNAKGFPGSLSNAMLNYFKSKSSLSSGLQYDHIRKTLSSMGFTGTLDDQLTAFFMSKTGINRRPDAERAFWKNDTLDFSIGGGIDANTVAMLHLDGANGSTTITDSAPVPKVWTAENGAVITTAVSKFGGACGNNPAASSSWFSTPVDAVFDFGTGNFTFDLWINPISLVAGNQSILSYGNPATGHDWMWFVTSTGQLRFFAETLSTVCDIITTDASVGTGTFKHFALTRSGANMYMHQDGVPLTIAVTTALGATALPTGATALYLGARSSNNDSHFDTRFDEVRISNVARYGAGSFTPASAAYSA